MGGFIHVPLFWHKHLAKAEAKRKYRAIHLERCNPDYQLAHVAEHKANPDCKVLKVCNPEACKRVEHDMEKIIRSSKVPLVIRPVRLNRV